jgi:hypothetical protein
MTSMPNTFEHARAVLAKNLNSVVAKQHPALWNISQALVDISSAIERDLSSLKSAVGRIEDGRSR